MPIIIRPCTTKAGFEALPTENGSVKFNNRSLDLSDAAKRLSAQGCDVLEAGVLLIVHWPGLPELTIYPSGRAIIKAEDVASARKTAETIFKAIGLE